MSILKVIVKVINNGRKILTLHEIIDHIAKQIMLVITQVCKESKLLGIHGNLRRPTFSFTYSLSSLTFVL